MGVVDEEVFDGDVEFWAEAGTVAWKATRFEIVHGVFSRRGVQRLDWGCRGEVGRAEVAVERARSVVVRRRSMFGAEGACETPWV